MKEIIRQFVIFGNFNSVTFESVLKLDKLREKYKLQINAMPDIPELLNNQPINVSLTPPESRPVFQTANRKLTVFFGTRRIHIEQFDSDSATFNDYNGMAMTIICEVVKALNLNVTRLAINGQLFIDDVDLINKTFNTIFNKSELYSGHSEEWQFRIGSKEIIPALDCEVNKIVQYTRGEFIVNNKNNQKGLIESYDFNTQYGISKFFSLNEIQIFNDLAQKYRNLFI